MTAAEIINRGYYFGQLVKQGLLNLKSYPVTPFSSLTARSDHAVNDRFKQEPNEYTPQEQRLIEELLANMSVPARISAKIPEWERMKIRGLRGRP